MGLQIVDGLGRGNEAGVSDGNRLMTVSKSNIRGYYVSRDEQRAFNWIFSDATLAAGTYAGYLQNTSVTRNMFIDLIRLSAVNNIYWKIVAATGTATGGSAVTAINLNRNSGISSESSTAVQDNIGGFTAGAVIAHARTLANSQVDVPFDDMLILGPNNAIAFEGDAVGGTGIAEVLVRGFYEDI